MDRNQPQTAEIIEQIALATRMSVMEGLLDFSGHISSRVPGHEAILIQSGKAARSHLSSSEVLIVGMDGTVLSGEGAPPLELALHLGIYRARPDIGAVLHSHLLDAVAFTLMRDIDVQIMRPAASRWAGGIPTHSYPGSINSVQQADAFARTLGDANGALLRAHGLVLCAESVPAVFMDSVYFLENLRTNMIVLQSGRAAMPLTEEECAELDVPRTFNVQKLWAHFRARAAERGLLG